MTQATSDIVGLKTYVPKFEKTTEIVVANLQKARDEISDHLAELIEILIQPFTKEWTINLISIQADALQKIWLDDPLLIHQAKLDDYFQDLLSTRVSRVVQAINSGPKNGGQSTFALSLLEDSAQLQVHRSELLEFILDQIKTAAKDKKFNMMVRTNKKKFVHQIQTSGLQNHRLLFAFYFSMVDEVLQALGWNGKRIHQNGPSTKPASQKIVDAFRQASASQSGQTRSLGSRTRVLPDDVVDEFRNSDEFEALSRTVIKSLSD